MPSDKRTRQRAGREARQAQLAAAQTRSRRTRQALVVGVVILAAIGLTIYVGTRGSSTKKVVAGSSSTTTPTTTPGPSTTVAAGAPSAATAASLAALKAHPAPAVASAAVCDATPTPSTSATTVPARGPAVATIDAPAGVGFPKADGSSPHYTHFDAAPPFCIDVSKTYTATMVTDIGTVTISLYPKDAPLAVNNFVFLAGYHYFDGTIFHRVIPGFVDQGGDPTGTGEGGPGYKFADELPSSAAAYDNGAVAMANSGTDTNGSQIFLVVNGGGSQLQPLYSDFGQITGGLAVADKINTDGSSSGTPTVVHKIVSVSITES